MELMSVALNTMPNISVITEIEALSWVSADKPKEEIVKSFINDANIINLTSEIVKKCISIRRNRKIKTPDAIIAATAIVNNYTLITSDTDFDKIPDLKIIDPKKISPNNTTS
jgi:predicted nucleic acid-binding protein